MASTARTPYAYLLIAHMDIPTSDMKMLMSSWESAFQRFELLRTRMIPGHGGSALQVVMKSSALMWEEVSDIKTFAEYVYDNHDYGQPLARVGFVKAASRRKMPRIRTEQSPFFSVLRMDFMMDGLCT